MRSGMRFIGTRARNHITINGSLFAIAPINHILLERNLIFVHIAIECQIDKSPGSNYADQRAIKFYISNRRGNSTRIGSPSDTTRTNGRGGG